MCGRRDVRQRRRLYRDVVLVPAVGRCVHGIGWRAGYRQLLRAGAHRAAGLAGSASSRAPHLPLETGEAQRRQAERQRVERPKAPRQQARRQEPAQQQAEDPRPAERRDKRQQRRALPES
jgi:hypothetical protein